MTGVRHPGADHGSWFGRLLQRAVLGALLLAVLIVGGTAFRIWQVARTDDRTPADFAVVLGAAQYNGRPSPILQARLEHALTLYRQHVVPTIVTVGGRRPGDNYSEAEASGDWLTAHGVPAGHIVTVGQGSDTLRSMQAVAATAQTHHWHTVVVVSDPWHTFRARTMADDVGLRAWGSPTWTGPVVQTRGVQSRYIIRETGALLFYRFTHAPADDVGIDI